MREPDKLRQEIETLRTRLLKMSEVSRRVTESLDLDTVLQEVVDGARSLTGARYGAVGVFDESGQVQDFITSGITSEERLLLGSLPEGLGLLTGGWPGQSSTVHALISSPEDSMVRVLINSPEAPNSSTTV